MHILITLTCFKDLLHLYQLLFWRHKINYSTESFPEVHILVLEAEMHERRKPRTMYTQFNSNPYGKVVLFCPKRVGEAKKCVHKRPLDLSHKG